MRSIISSKKKFRKLIREMVKKVLKEDFNSASGKNYDDLEKDGVSYNPPFEEMKKETVVIEDLDFKSVSNWERFQDVFDVVDPMETRDSNYTDEYKFRSTVYFKETSLVDAEFQVRMYFEETPGFLTNIEGKKI